MKSENGASKWALLGGVSFIAALAMASSAQAACTPDNGTVTCIGDTAPFTITSDTQTIIAQGATVTGSSLSAIRLNSARANLRIDGTISATGAAAPTYRRASVRWSMIPMARIRRSAPMSIPIITLLGGRRWSLASRARSRDTGIWTERTSSNYLGDSTADCARAKPG